MLRRPVRARTCSPFRRWHDVYAALAGPQVMTNCNAAIFVNSQDVLVVDAHSKPSVAAALIAQIKKEITPKPVRYLVNSHFHWDHTKAMPPIKRAARVWTSSPAT